MPNSVDNRVVSMKFDNAEFERRVSTTQSSLAQLKQSLNFDGAAKGFADISAAAKNFTLEGLGNAIENISNKFSTMGVVGFSVINNLVGQAISAGEKLGKSLSLDQAISGFQEYNTNITSIQTILANTNSKGTTLEDVNKALDELNTYSDKTIYNFAEMAKNVGTFTAAGVDLQTSVASIKGIANLAALSGSSAEQAATGMYQLSQAISTGTVRLIDWNSVQNAGFGGEIFQKALFETGKQLKTIKGIDMATTFEEWKKANGSFRDSLSGNGAAVSETDKLAQANVEAAKIVKDAEKDVADTTESQNQRVIDAKQRVADEAKNGAQAIQDASERQKRVISDDAKAIESAWQNVIDARKRLENALKPASENELAAAQDRLTSSQLDQADLSDAIARAELASTKALDRETQARKKLAAAQAAGDLNAENQAWFELQDAQNAVADASDGVARAQLRQRAAARDVADAQQKLAEVQNKGSANDQNVISAQDNLQNAQDRYQQTLEDSAKRERDASDAVAKAREDSARRQQDAIKNLAKVEDDRTTQIARVQDRLAKAHEDAAARIQKASDGVQFSWLTSDVLTTTLKNFTGDLSDAQIKALGFSDAQVKNIQTNAKLASEAATVVKTLPQLLSTVREAIGSGWGITFRNIFGTFEEAKVTFTDFNNAISSVVGRSADARNKILDDWKTMGGRTLLIRGITQVFQDLASYIKPIKDAFRDIFPRKTGAELYALTKRFVEFADRMRLSGDNAEKIRHVLRGVFAAFSIVKTVVKDVVVFFGKLIGIFTGVAGSPILNVLGGVADVLVYIDKKLKEGKGLEGFLNLLLGGARKIAAGFSTIMSFVVPVFKAIGSGALSIGSAIKLVVVKMGEFFKSFDGNIFKKIASFFGDFAHGASKAAGAVNNTALAGGIKYLGKIGERLADIWHGLVIAAQTFGNGMVQLGKLVEKAAVGIWHAVYKTFGKAGFSGILDAANVGIFAALAIIIKRFTDKGLVGLLGGGDLINSIKGMFNGVTNVLSALQTQIKAGALLKIAGAIAILAGSLILLSLVDSASLTKGLVAISVLGVLLSTMMQQLTDIARNLGDSKNILIVVGALLVLSGAMFILSMAVKKLAKLDPAGVAVGTAAILVLLTGITQAAKQFAEVNSSEAALFKTAVGIFAIASAVKKLAKVVAILGSMDTKELVQGMVAVGLLLTGLTVAIDNLPKKDEGKIGSLIGFAIGIRILASAVGVLGGMDVETIIKGLAATGVALGGIVIFLQQLDKLDAESISVGLVGFAFGILTLGVALRLIGSLDVGSLAKGLVTIGAVLTGLFVFLKALDGINATEISVGFFGLAAGILALGIALRIIGGISIGDLAKGLITIGLALPILALGLNLMDSAGPGALVLGVAAGGLLLLAAALKAIGSLGIGDLVKGLVGIVAVIAILAGASLLLSEAIVPMIAMGVALTVIGAGFALFGIGVKSFAEGIAILAKSGDEGIRVFRGLVGVILDNITQFVGGIGGGILQLVGTIAKAAPQIAKAFGPVIIEFLKTFANAIPQLAITVGKFISHLVKLIVDKAPEIIAAGFKILMNFLSGILDNIGAITVAVVKIVEKFLESLASQAGDLVGAGLNLLVKLIEGIASGLASVAKAAVDVVVAFISAIAGGIAQIIQAGIDIVVSFLKGIANSITQVSAAAVGIVVAFLEAIAGEIERITQAGTDIIVAVLEGIAATVSQIGGAAVDLVTSFIETLGGGAIDITTAGVDMVVKLLEGIAKGITNMTSAATDIIVAFVQGIGNGASRVAQAASDTIVAFLNQLDDNLVAIVDAGFEFITNFINGIADSIDKHADDLRNAGLNLAGSLIDGMTFGLAGKAKDAVGGIIGLGKSVIGGALSVFGINSPSRVFRKIAGGIAEGLVLGFDKDKTAQTASEAMGGRVISSFQNTLNDLSDAFTGVTDINPVITPVLDLTKMQNDAKSLTNMLGNPTITAGVSFAQASMLSKATQAQALTQADTPTQIVKEIKFEQTIHAPTQLSTADIYRGTKSQIQMAKGELLLA